MTHQEPATTAQVGVAVTGVLDDEDLNIFMIDQNNLGGGFKYFDFFTPTWGNDPF